MKGGDSNGEERKDWEQGRQDCVARPARPKYADDQADQDPRSVCSYTAPRQEEALGRQFLPGQFGDTARWDAGQPPFPRALCFVTRKGQQLRFLTPAST
jgi:hypothetical protein